MKLDERRSEEQKQRETDRVLVLRTCAADLTSKNGFVWPSSGHVLCPDWAPTAECGHGLHGLLWGAGDGSLLDWSLDAKWLVVAVEPSQLVALDGKVKFAAGEVVHCGDQASATAFLSRDPRAICVVGGTSTSGARGTSISGARGTSISGDWGTSTSGDGGTSISGDWGTSTSGDGGTSTSGDGGTSTSGDWGTSTSGDGGTSTSGDWGTSTSGDGGTSISGDGGELRIRWRDSRANRYRTVIAYVGENGIKPNVPYRLNDVHEFVEVTP